MQNGLTNKTWRLINGPLESAVTPEEAELAKSAFIDGADHFECGDGTLFPRLGTTIVPPEKIDHLWRRRSGQWQCRYGNWHQKGERDCQCRPPANETQYCGKCDKGWLFVPSVNDPNPAYRGKLVARACECNVAGRLIVEEERRKMMSDPTYQLQRQQEQDMRLRQPSADNSALDASRDVFGSGEGN